MLSFITFTDALTVTKVALGIGLLIFVHEFGHFIVARKLGIRVEIFSIGFGPPIFSIKHAETEYRISAFPLGGYVKLCGENPDDKLMGVPYEFLSRKPHERFLVFLAGAAMNFLIAFPLAMTAYLIGVNFAKATVATVFTGTLEWELGLQEGDEILTLNDQPIENFVDYKLGVSLIPEGQDVKLTIKRNGNLLEVGPVRKTRGTKSVFNLDASLVIDRVEPGQPAHEAGMKPGDEIVSIDGKAIRHWQEVQRIFKENPGRPLAVEVRRRSGQKEEKTLTLTLRPKPTIQHGLFPPTRPIISTVKPFSPAHGKLKSGDRILSINGKPVGNYKDVSETIATSPIAPLAIEVERQNQRLTFSITPVMGASGKPLIGIIFDDSPILGRIPHPESCHASPLAGTGLQEGDRILYIMGEKVETIVEKDGTAKEKRTPWKYEIQRLSDIDTIINRLEQPWRPVNIVARRYGLAPTADSAGKEIEPHSLLWAGKLSCAPIVVVENVRPGHELTGMAYISPKPKMVRVRYGVLAAFRMALLEPFHIVGMTWNALRGIFREREIAKSVAGPIGIIQFSFLAAQEGIGQFIYLLLVITVSLALINLLPIPVLDGGHILMLLIEKLRGKRLAEKTLALTQYIGLAVILTIFLMATYNDIRRIFGL